MRYLIAALIMTACGPYDQLYIEPAATPAAIVPAACHATHTTASFDATHTIYHCGASCLYVYAPREGLGVVKEVPCFDEGK